MPIPGEYSSGTLPKTPAWRLRGGAICPTIRKGEPVKSGATFQAFELVTMTSNEVDNLGALADPSAAAITASLADGDLVLGMALQGASGNSTVDIIMADDNVEFLLRLYNATATSAEKQDVKIGDLTELFRYNGAGDIQTVCSPAPNGTDGINKGVITELPDARSATDQFPGVWVKIRSGERFIP